MDFAMLWVVVFGCTRRLGMLSGLRRDGRRGGEDGVGFKIFDIFATNIREK